MRKKNRLPVVAFLFGIAPVILLLLAYIPFIGIAFGYLFFMTWWGLGFQAVGLILGIIALCGGRKEKGLSIFAILSPFIWYGVLQYLANYTSVEIFL